MTTTAERLSSIETILERLEPKVDGLVTDVAADKADLAAVKNRGAGILIGVAVVFALIGAKIEDIIGAIAAAFK